MVRVNSNEVANPQAELPLSGSGTAPVITVVPAAVDFGGVVLGESEVASVTITNEGTATLDISSVTVTGDAFSASDAPVDITTLNPGESLSVDLTFAPSELGEANGSLQILSNAPTSPTQVPWTGNGLPIPVEIEVTPEVLEFGAVFLGESSELVLTIDNPGDVALSVSDVQVSDGGDVGFALSEPFAGPLEVASGDEFDVTVTFTPAAEGEVNGAVVILSDAEVNPQVTVNLSGSGSNVPMPTITVTPGQVDLGDVDVGSEDTAEVQIENTGDADLTVEDILIAEGAAAGFSVTGVPADPLVLAPGEVLSVNVVFVPDTAGPATGLLSVLSDAANGAEQLVSLQGTGIDPAAPGIEVDPLSLAFGGVPVGGDATLSFTIGNPGDAVLEVTLSLASEVFTLENVPSEVAAGDEATVTVRFSPMAVGEVTGSVQITSNAQADAIMVALSGTGDGVPELSVSPLSIDFGDVVVGDDATQGVEVSNTGTGPLQVDAADLTGDAAFTLSTALGDGLLNAGEALTLEVVYSPSQEGESTGSLAITGGGATQTVDLTGTGVPAPEALIEVTPGAIGFGDVEIGGTVEEDLTIENTGDAVLSITEIALTGDSNEDFELQGGVTEATEVEPGGQLVVTVRFTPTSVGDATGGVSIVSNAANDDTIVIDVDGAGIPSPVAEIAVTPNIIDFGTLLGGNGETTEVQIENTGTLALNVDDLVLGGATDAFAVDDTSAFTLEPGENTVIVVSFSPVQAGEANATLTINSNANETPEVIVELRSEGISALIDVQPTSLDFDPQDIGQSQVLSIDVTNEGTAQLDLTNVSIDEASFILGEVPASVAPGVAETIAVTFMSDREGDITGELTIENNSVNAPEVVLNLSGTGTVPAQ